MNNVYTWSLSTVAWRNVPRFINMLRYKCSWGWVQPPRNEGWYLPDSFGKTTGSVDCRVFGDKADIYYYFYRLFGSDIFSLQLRSQGLQNVRKTHSTGTDSDGLLSLEQSFPPSRHPCTIVFVYVWTIVSFTCYLFTSGFCRGDTVRSGTWHLWITTS